MTDSRIYEQLAAISDRLARVDTHGAVHAQKLSHVEEHLRVQNGRIGKGEVRISSLEITRSETRGAGRVVAWMAGVVGACVTWAVDHFIK